MLVNAVLILLPLGTWLASEPPMDPKESRGEVQERYSLSYLPLDRACLTQHTRLSFVSASHSTACLGEETSLRIQAFYVRWILN